MACWDCAGAYFVVAMDAEESDRNVGQFLLFPDVSGILMEIDPRVSENNHYIIRGYAYCGAECFNMPEIPVRISRYENHTSSNLVTAVIALPAPASRAGAADSLDANAHFRPES